MLQNINQKTVEITIVTRSISLSMNVDCGRQGIRELKELKSRGWTDGFLTGD